MSNDMLNLLNYLYNDFTVSFVICLSGAIIKDLIDTYKNNTKINIKQIILATIFTTILLCAIKVYIDINFNIYILICIVSGMWGDEILRLFTNSTIVVLILKKVLKLISNPISDLISDTIDDIEKKEEDHKE